MAIVWNLEADVIGNGQNPGWGVLNKALKLGLALPGATTTEFQIKSGSNLAVFHGNFVVNAGVVQSGVITGFDVYHDSLANHLIEATGHAIEYGAFANGVAALKAGDPVPLYQQLLAKPMTVNGADHPLFGDAIVGGYAADHLYGKAGEDFINDVGGSDVIYGGAGNDMIIGDAPYLGSVPGNDTIYGGDGADDIDGQGGNDFLSGGAGKDALNGKDGSDTADYSEKVDRLKVKLDGPNEVGVEVAGFVEDRIRNIENINGGSQNDKLVGDGYANQFVGNGGNDKLKGKNGDDVLIGLKGKDKLNGGKDADTLTGGKGKDVHKGGPGADVFLFDVEPKGKHADKVKDFHGKDMVALDADVFTKVNNSGKLKSKYFVEAKQAQDKNDHLVYHDGVLSYDSDGAGGKDAKAIATFKGDPHLHADDFFIV